MKTGQLKVGAQKAFSSGTSLKGELTYSDIETEMFDAQSQVSGATTMSKFEEADIIFELQQSLLNNSFGSATRSQLSAGEAQGSSVVQQYRLDIGQWMVNFRNILQCLVRSVSRGLKAYLRNTKTITKNNKNSKKSWRKSRS